MKQIKPDRNKADNEYEDWFDPNYMEDGVLRCCCGYELKKESEDTYRCTGGNHRYIISDGDVTTDKFGNILIKLKQENEKSNPKRNN